MALDEQQLLQCYRQLHRIFPDDLHIARPFIQLLREQGQADLAQHVALSTAKRMLAVGRSAQAIGFLSLCQQLGHPDISEIESLYSMARISGGDAEDGATLKLFPLLEQLSDEESLDFIRQGSMVRAEAGGNIVRQGEDSRTFYLILDGEVKVCLELESGDEVLLNRMGASNFFGEFACVYRLRRTATVAATKPTLLLEFSDRSIAELLEHSPLAGDYLIRTIKNRLVGAMTYSIPAFADVPDADRHWLSDMSLVDEYQPGETIPSMVDRELSCNILLNGAAELVIKSPVSGREIRRPVAKGAFFGDASADIKIPSESRMVATERTLVCRIPNHIFQTFMNLYHSFEAHVRGG